MGPCLQFIVKLIIDHCIIFLTQSNLSARQVRWQTFLSEYNIQVGYIPGPENVFADGLSRRRDLRLMVVGALGTVDCLLKEIFEGVTLDRVSEKHLNTALNEGKRSNTCYKLLHGVLYYQNDGRYRVYVSSSKGLRKRLLSLYHDVPAAGPFGTEKSFRALRQFYYWPNMREHVADYVRRCPHCQRNKPTRSLPSALHPLPVASGPFECITLD
jgi:hypothetical protein